MLLTLHTSLRTTISALLLVAVLGVCGGTPLTALAVQAQATSSMTRALEASERESGGNFGCMDPTGGAMLTGCLAWISYHVMGLAAWLAGGASVILNYAVQELVVGMGLIVGNLKGVTDAWVVLRDIANVFLLFLTIFIGIATILNLSAWNYKQLLWKVIIAALFVNFSLFFTKIVIDVSNLAATELYVLILSQRGGMEECKQVLSTADFSGKCIGDGIAGAFWDQMRLATFYDISQVPPDKRGDATMRMVWVGALGTILFLVAAFVFGAAAFLLIGRFVILVLLMIFSPIAFVVWITKISGMGSQWWRKLLNQAFFAPAVLLMWWIALKIMMGLNERYVLSSVSGDFALSALMTMSGISLLFYFIIVMGFLIASLIVAKNMGAAGADSVMNTGKSLAKGTAGGLFAYTAGAASGALAREYARRHAEANKVDEQGRYINNDARARLYRRMSGTMIDRGIAKGVSAGARTGVLGTRSFDKRREDARTGTDARRTEINLQDSRDSLINAGRDLATLDPSVPANQARIERAKSTIASASQSNLEWARYQHSSLFNNKAVLAAHSATQTEATLKKSTTLGGEAAKLKEARYGDLRSAVTAAAAGTALTPEQAAARRNVTVRDIENNHDVYTSTPTEAQHWSEETYAGVMKSDTISDSAKESFRQKRYSVARDAMAKSVRTPDDKQEIANLSITAIEHNRDMVAANPTVVHDMTNDRFEKLLESKAFDSNEKTNFKTERMTAMKTKVPSLSPEKYEELLKSKVFNDSEKAAFKQERSKALTTALQAPTRVPADIAREANKLTQKDLENLDANVLQNPDFISNLKADKFTALTGKDSKLATPVRDAMVLARKQHFAAMSDTDLANAVNTMDPAGVASLDAATITRDAAKEKLDVSDMIEITKKHNKVIRQDIRTYWEGKYAPVKAKLAANPNTPLTPDESKAKKIGEWLDSPTGGAIF